MNCDNTQTSLVTDNHQQGGWLLNALHALSVMTSGCLILLWLVWFREIEKYSGYHTGRLSLLLLGIFAILVGSGSFIAFRMLGGQWTPTTRWLLVGNLIVSAAVMFYAIWPRTPEAMAAANSRSLRWIKFYGLIGVNLNGRARWGWNWDCEGETPLTATVFKGDITVVEALLDAGADVNATDGWRETASAKAALYEKTEILQLLFNRGGKEGTLASAVKWLKPDMVQWLLEHGADATERGIIWSAISHEPSELSIYKANDEIVGQIIAELAKHGADLNVERIHETPLTYCLRNKRPSYARHLIGNGADVNREDKDHGLPLQLAADKGDFETAECLVRSGANIHKRASSGVTPLMAAHHGGNVAIIELLLEAGLKIEDGDPSGLSFADAAITGYARTKSTEALRFTLAHGASPTGVDGSSPLRHAVEGGYVEAVKILVEAGADPDQPALRHSEPALYTAIRQRNLEMVKLLISVGAKKIPAESWDGGSPEINAFARNVRQEYAQ